MTETALTEMSRAALKEFIYTLTLREETEAKLLGTLRAAHPSRLAFMSLSAFPVKAEDLKREIENVLVMLVAEGRMYPNGYAGYSHTKPKYVERRWFENVQAKIKAGPRPTGAFKDSV